MSFMLGSHAIPKTVRKDLHLLSIPTQTMLTENSAAI